METACQKGHNSTATTAITATRKTNESEESERQRVQRRRKQHVSKKTLLVPVVVCVKRNNWKELTMPVNSTNNHRISKEKLKEIQSTTPQSQANVTSNNQELPISTCSRTDQFRELKTSFYNDT